MEHVLHHQKALSVMMNYAVQSDSRLVALYAKGDNSAFSTLLKKYRSKVFSVIYKVVKNRETTEDLVQDVFIKLMDTVRSGKYKEEGKFASWLLRIAGNLAVDHFRKKKRQPGTTDITTQYIPFTSYSTDQSPEALRIREETHSTLRNLVHGLPEPQRQVVIMRHYEDMSFKEIADATGVSINTSLGRMRYALINLRKNLGDPQDDPQ